MSPATRVGRRKEPIEGYVSKNYDKKNSGRKGLIENNYFIDDDKVK